MNPTRLSRRSLLAAAAGLVAGAAAGVHAQAPTVFAEVWKDEGCGCCDEWVKHLQANGFKVKLHDGGHHPMRQKLGVDRKYASCHVALIGGYAIEGHVPAREIQRLLKEKPAAVGLSVPGMPVGSPGMEGPYGDRQDAYDVLLLAKDGTAAVYQRYPARKA